TNERTYPYFVDIPVAAVGLDVALSHQIMKFHKSRQLQLRHGRTNSRGGENYYRWCFADLTTALAFVEQFGGVLRPANCLRGVRRAASPAISPSCRSFCGRLDGGTVGQPETDAALSGVPPWKNTN